MADQLAVQIAGHILTWMERMDRGFTCAAICTKAVLLKRWVTGQILGIHYLRLSRSGLKRYSDAAYQQFRDSWLNGRGGPFGFETMATERRWAMNLMAKWHGRS